MPKVFISFLGAIAYERTQYYFDKKDNLSSPTPFVQEAIFEKMLSNIWSKEDKIFICTTKDAFDNNYNNRIVKFNMATQQAEYATEKDGLASRLTSLKERGKIAHFENINIPNGNTVEEIWTVFEAIHTKLKDLPPQSKVYFDITYGFRSLPMLGIVLLNYIKTLYNIHVEYVFYGNFEMGRQEKNAALIQAQTDKLTDEQIQVMKAMPPCSPILDLRPFVELQSWTTAAQTFLSSGNAKLLAELTQPSNPILADNLTHFTEAILTCRGKMLTHDLDVDSFKNLVTLGRLTVYEAQLKPILERVEQKLEKFNSQNTQNGFSAVEWCIENGLVQQGYTFLQETVVAYVVESVFGKEALFNHDYRDAAASALNGYKRRNGKIPMETETTAAFNFLKPIRGLREHYKKLTGNRGLRNDINHAGFKENYASPDQLRNDLKDIYTAIKKILV
jgi:CRISPR-associated Csx2 family protein